ncbi:SMC-Scp complex subunit ScpB [Dyella lutea]|uniref:SMC-Scp complex subunit ScpB n=1 Tax=Dyella lutea TaxID=2950441 RepID=A0ABT1FBT0_9GAMM|nr:SMC-Scp complex subunit ScpB [Dyella lutea]MCP1374824.1 SMC-Scp complex subunit ScpB [Dyella lutea]
MSDNQELASPVRDEPVRQEPLGIEQLKPIVEAALLASSNPLTMAQLVELFGEEHEVTRELVARTLEALAGDCEGRGVELKEIASGFRYQVKQAVHPWLSRMWTERPSRYSRALLETLALIAYRQPITRPEIEQIRGVVVSSNIIKTLEERDWIRVVGHRDVPGRPALFGTTRAFLDYFNLKSLDQLPPLSEIRDMEDPQLRFEPEPLPARVVKDLPIDPEAEAQATTSVEDADPAQPADATAARDDIDPAADFDVHDLAEAANPTGMEEAANDDTENVATAPDGAEEEPVSAADLRDGTPPAPDGLSTEPTTADEAAIPADAGDGDTDKHS